MSNVKVGLIGCGRIARVHLDILQKLPDAEVVALAEADAQRREAIQERVPDAAAFSDFRKLLAVPEIDAVIITVPTWLHAEVATAAVNAGKHIYLEKPLSADLSSADRLIAAWQESGVQAMIGFNYRLNPLHLEARDLLQAGRIGQVFAVRTIFASEGGELPGWLQRRETGGGALLELGSHHFDLLPYLLGSEIRDVQAVIESRRTEDDYAALTMTLEDEAVVQSTFFLGARQEDRFEIYGTGGKLVIDRFRSLRVELTSDAPAQGRFHSGFRGRRTAAPADGTPLAAAVTPAVSTGAAAAHAEHTDPAVTLELDGRDGLLPPLGLMLLLHVIGGLELVYGKVFFGYYGILYEHFVFDVLGAFLDVALLGLVILGLLVLLYVHVEDGYVIFGVRF